MQCLWRWATAKAAESTDSSEPVTLRRVRGLGCADLVGLQVGGRCQPHSGILCGNAQFRGVRKLGTCHPTWAVSVTLLLFL